MNQNQKLLLYAVTNGRIDIAKRLLKKNVNVNIKDNHDNSLLMISIMNNDLPMFKLLLENNADPTIENKQKQTALMMSVDRENIEMVDFLLKAKAYPNVRDQYGYTPLMVASEHGYLDIVKLLLKHTILVDLQTPTSKNNALMFAVTNGHVDIAKTLLDAGANVNITNSRGSNVLMLAISTNNKELIKLILKHRPCLDIRNEDKITALFLAVVINARFSDNVDIIEMLIKCGANIEISDGNGISPFLAAVNSQNTEVIKLLLKHKADPNSKDHKNNTALMKAAQRNDIDIMELLIEKGADVNKRDNDGNTALMDAVLISFINGIELLIKHKANLNIQNRDGNTALILAACSSEEEDIDLMVKKEVLKVLLDAKADVNIKNNNGHTALIVASDIYRARLLLQYGANKNEIPKILNAFVRKLLQNGFTQIQSQKRLIPSEASTVWQDICRNLSNLNLERLVQIATESNIRIPKIKDQLKLKRKLCYELAKQYEKINKKKYGKQDCNNPVALSGEMYEDLPAWSIVTYKDRTDGKLYCFTIEELEKLEEMDQRNPYNRQLIPDKVFTKAKTFPNFKQHQLRPTSIATAKDIKMKLIRDKLQQLREHYEYLDYDKIINLSEEDLINMSRELNIDEVMIRNNLRIGRLDAILSFVNALNQYNVATLSSIMEEHENNEEEEDD